MSTKEQKVRNSKKLHQQTTTSQIPPKKHNTSSKKFSTHKPSQKTIPSSQQRTKLKLETQLPSTIRKRKTFRKQLMERKRKKTRTGKRNTRKRSRRILQRWSRKELNKNNIFLVGVENRPEKLAHYMIIKNDNVLKDSYGFITDTSDSKWNNA